MRRTENEKAVETILAVRCPCGHLANRHRKPDPSFRVGDMIETIGACRDCSCKGILAVAPDAASTPEEER